MYVRNKWTGFLVFLCLGVFTAPGAKAEESKIYQMGEVTVTAKRGISPVLDPLTPEASSEMTTKTITRKEIEAQNAKTAIEALEFAPNVTVTSMGRKWQKFVNIRGEKALILLNGVSDVVGAYDVLSAASVGRIKIIRDSSTLLYGNTGLGGVINIITREPVKPETHATVEGGSFDRQFYEINHGGRYGDIGYFVNLSKDKSHGKDGTNTAYNLYNANGRFNWYFDKNSRATVNLNYIDGTREIQTNENKNTWVYGEMWEYNPYKFFLASTEILKVWSDHSSTDIDVYYRDRKPNLINHYDYKPDTERIEQQKEYGVDVRQALQFGDNNTLRFGGQFNRFDSPEGSLYYVGERTATKTYSLFMQDEAPFGNLTLDGGIRWDRTYLDEYSSFWGKNKPKIKNKWEDPLLNVSLGARYELNTEMAASFRFATGKQNPRPGTTKVDGSSLESEEWFKFDGGFEYTWRKWLIGRITLFHVQKNNGLEYDGAKQINQDNWITYYKNVGTKQYGGELEFHGQLMKNLAYFVNYCLTHTSNVTEQVRGMKGPLSFGEPRHNGAMGLRYNDGRYVANATGKYVSAYESTRFLKGKRPNPVTVGDYFRLNANFGYIFKYRSLRSELYVDLQNILNKRYETVVGWPDPGFQAIIGLKVSL